MNLYSRRLAVNGSYLKQLIRMFGDYSLGIYLIHAAFLLVSVKLLSFVSVFTDYIAFYPVSFCLPQ